MEVHCVDISIDDRLSTSAVHSIYALTIDMRIAVPFVVVPNLAVGAVAEVNDAVVCGVRIWGVVTAATGRGRSRPTCPGTYPLWALQYMTVRRQNAYSDSVRQLQPGKSRRARGIFFFRCPCLECRVMILLEHSVQGTTARAR